MATEPTALEARRAEFLRLMRRRTTECKRCEGATSQDPDDGPCPDCHGGGLIFLCDDCATATEESDGPLCEDCIRDAHRDAIDAGDTEESDEARQHGEYEFAASK